MIERVRQIARNASVGNLVSPIVWLVVLGCFVAWGYFHQKEFRRALTFLECRKDWRSTGEFCERIYRSKAKGNTSDQEKNLLVIDADGGDDSDHCDDSGRDRVHVNSLENPHKYVCPYI